MANNAEGLLEREDAIDSGKPGEASGPDVVLAAAATEEDYDWLGELTSTGSGQRDAIKRLHELMLRAARFKLSRMGEASRLGHVRADEIVQSSADEAVVAILAKLSTF
ncbi:MAG: hypothetical protein KDB18_01635, partial [Salinibacterium sp.]|nr:hypothetical protein [Salinibacterium sp.]